MGRELRTVGLGLIFGLIGLIFGILWAVYIVVGHEAIHDRLRADYARPALSVPHAGADDHHDAVAVTDTDKRDDVNVDKARGGHSHTHKMKAQDAKGRAVEALSTDAGVVTPSEHDDPVMEVAHERLTRGHLHAMGLGTIALVISILLSFLGGPGWIRFLASASVGLGGLIYPLSWIVMGYRTPSLGIEAAHESVFLIVVASVPLVLGGLGLTLLLVLWGVLSKGRQV